MTPRESAAQSRRSHWRSLAVAALTVIPLLLVSVPMRAQITETQERLAWAKLDRVLQRAVDRGSTETQRVIIRAKAGKLRELEKAVDALGHEVLNELVSSRALVVKVPTADLLELAAEPTVATISTDGPIRSPDPRPARPTSRPDSVAVTIVAASGRTADVTRDLAMHRDVVTFHDGRRIAAKVHPGDVAVLAHHPAVLSIIINESR